MGRWSDLPTNRWIAKADILNALTTGAVTLIGTAPSIGDEQFISKAQMEAWINSTGVGASNQWQYKSAIVCPPPNSHVVYYPGEVNIATTPALACAVTNAITVYSSCSTLNNGCRIWNLFGFWVGNPSYPNEWYKTNDGRVFQIATNGDIINMQTCPSPSTAFTVRLDFNTANICTAATSTVYTSGGWGVGVTIYSDSGLTTPVTSYNHVINVADGIIYDIDNTNGLIQADSGLTC